MRGVIHEIDHYAIADNTQWYIMCWHWKYSDIL